MRIHSIAVLAIVLIVASCSKGGYDEVARVGDVYILRSDIELRTAVYVNCRMKPRKDTTEVLAEIIRDALEKATLQKFYGIAPPESVLKQKAKRIDRDTKAPEMLACIKSIYGSDKDAYLRNVVEPILVNNKLHSLFAIDSLVHARERDSAAAIMKNVKSHKIPLSSVAGYDTFRTPKIPQNERINQYIQTDLKNPLVEKVLKNLGEGEIYSDIVEDDLSYKIIRLIGESDSDYVWDGIVISKNPFDEWFKDYVLNNISIEIYDTSLKRKFYEKYPDLWWREIIR